MSNKEIIQTLGLLLDRIKTKNMLFMCINLENMLDMGISCTHPIMVELYKDRVQANYLHIISGAWYNEKDRKSRITNINRTIKRLSNKKATK